MASLGALPAASAGLKLRQGGKQAVLRQLSTSIEFPFNTIVVVLDGPFEHKPSHIEDARIL